MSRPLRVLIVEDSEVDSGLLLHELRRGSYEPVYERVDTLEAMTAALNQQPWDIVLADYTLPHFSTTAALTLIEERGLDLPFIIVSDSIGEDTAVAAMKAGAHDYIIKGNLKRLIPAVERELREAEVRREHKRGEEALRAEIIECARRGGLLKARAREQAVVTELGHRALAGTELSLLMNEAVALVAQTLEVEYCKILELLPDGNALLLRAGVGWKEGLAGHTAVGTGESQAGYTLLSKEPVIVEDLGTETRFSRPRLLHDHGAVSGMTVIIPGQDRPFGILGAHTTTRRKFTQDDVNFLQAVANVLAAAIKHHQAEETIRFMAYHDTLTQLPNRILLQDRLQQAILAANRENKSLALLILDLNRFKEINDSMGHHNGDLLLKQVGFRLRDLLRDSDTVARLGGDEFAVVLPNVGYEGAILTAQKALRSLQAPYTLEEVSLDIQVSIGIALFPEHGEDADTLMRHSDMAMYVTKQVGHGYAVYTPEQHQQKPRHLALMRELRHAIEREEFLLHYQPKIDLRTNRVIGVEALVRWQHPLGGLISPEQFIPLAERTGLIKPLTQWVLNTALRQCQGWHQTGKEIGVAVNLSMLNLQDLELPDHVTRLLQTCGIPPRWLGLEITENVMMAQQAPTMEVLKRLGAMGGLSIDDFGTGYSSLANLKKLPINEIKIDKPLVMGMMTDEDDTVLVLSIINLAHNLGLKVVAEGVENKETLNQLAAFDCDTAQGYFMSRPLPPAEFTRWLSESPYGLKTA
jgi:diguanylate cyclase (GGDEF)-like protein